jgi:hypothetical protein
MKTPMFRTVAFNRRRDFICHLAHANQPLNAGSDRQIANVDRRLYDFTRKSRGKYRFLFMSVVKNDIHIVGIAILNERNSFVLTVGASPAQWISAFLAEARNSRMDVGSVGAAANAGVLDLLANTPADIKGARRKLQGGS